MFQPRISPAAPLPVREPEFQNTPSIHPVSLLGAQLQYVGLNVDVIKFCGSVTKVPSESSAEQLLNIVFVVIGRQMSFALARKSSLCHS